MMKETRKKRLGMTTGGLASIGIGASPFLGMAGKRQKLSLPGGPNLGVTSDLYRAARPGDLVMTGSPWGISRTRNINKALISSVMGNPTGYHPAVVKGKDAAGNLIVYEHGPDRGFREVTLKKSNRNHMSLFRPKDPKQMQRAMGNLENYIKTQDKLDKLLLDRGLSKNQVAATRASVYDKNKSFGIAARELFVPRLRKVNRAKEIAQHEKILADFNRNLPQHADTIATSIKKTGKLPKKNPLSCIAGVCTSAFAGAGVPVSPKTPAKWVGPNDFLRTDKYKSIGFSSGVGQVGLGGRYVKVTQPGAGTKAMRTLLKASPSLLRLGAGAIAGTIAYSLLGKKGKKIL